MSTTKYGLYFARARCSTCGSRQIKRRLYVAMRRHTGSCLRCGGTVEYVKAWWSYYVQAMQTGAVYVELTGNEP